jgi:hypothetical protein
MSRFSDDLSAALLGTANFESSIVETNDVVVEQDVVTRELVEEVREERAELSDSLDFVDEIGDDRNDIDAAAKVADIVASAANAVDTAAPSAVEGVVGLANCAIADAERIIDTEIPRLETDLHGAVTEVSMEGLGDWFNSTVKAFGAAMGSFGARVALGLSRLNDSSAGLTKRSMRVRGLIIKRDPEGGKPLKLSSGTQRLLVLNNTYATPAAIAESLTAFAATNIALTKAVEVYHTRLADQIKNRVIDAVSSGKANLDGLVQIQGDDLIKQISDIIKEQPAQFLGNQRYEFKEHRYNKVLTALLTTTDPDAKELIRHLDAPTSLSNEDLGKLLLVVETIVSESLKTLERISSSTKGSFKALESVVSKLNNTTESDDEVDLDDGVNKFELMRIESQLVSELGRVVDRLVDYQRDLVTRLDAVLCYAEESVFQG